MAVIIEHKTQLREELPLDQQMLMFINPDRLQTAHRYLRRFLLHLRYDHNNLFLFVYRKSEMI